MRQVVVVKKFDKILVRPASYTLAKWTILK